MGSHKINQDQAYLSGGGKERSNDVFREYCSETLQVAG